MLRERRIRKQPALFNLGNFYNPKKSLLRKKVAIKGSYQEIPLPTKLSYSNLTWAIYGVTNLSF